MSSYGPVMTERQPVRSALAAAQIALAGVIIAGGALAMAGQAGADPAEPIPVPADPAAPLVPGQPTVLADGPVAAPAPPPVGAPTVPEIPNPTYGGSSQTPGPGGYLRDLWRTARSGNLDSLMDAPAPVIAPEGASAGPPVPQGFYPLTGPPPPYYSGVGTPTSGSGPAPALPPGYYSLNGPPPPEYAAPVPVPSTP